MAYQLGVDLGTTSTAAVVLKTDAAPEIVTLGQNSPTAPSAIFIGTDGTHLYGDAAELRGLAEPERVIRGFKRRVGDSVPLVLAGDGEHIEHGAHDLAAAMIAWVVAEVTASQGEAPEAVAVTHPATWGGHKTELLRQALEAHGLGDAVLLSEPQAAAHTYAYAGGLVPGDTVAVYDLGDSFSAAVLRAESDGQFTVVGRPADLTQIGGVDFDDAVLSSVMSHLDPATRKAFGLDGADEIDADGAAALAALRTACAAAKVTLSTATSAVVPVAVAGKTTNIRLTRAEFETLVVGTMTATLAALEDTLDDAGVQASDLACVLLAGGSARIPLVTQMLSAHLGSSVAIARDIDPKMAIAAGAVLAIGTTWVHDEAPARAIPAQPAKAFVSGNTFVVAKAPIAASQSQVDGLAKARSRGRKQAEAPVPANIATVGGMAANAKLVAAKPAYEQAARPAPARATSPAVPAQTAAPAAPARVLTARPAAPAKGDLAYVPLEGRAARRVAARAAEAALAPAVEETAPVARVEPAPAPRPVVEPVLYFEDDLEDDFAYDEEPKARWYAVMRMPRGTVRRVMTVGTLTAAIFVGSGAWSAAIPATSEKPVAVKAVKHQGR